MNHLSQAPTGGVCPPSSVLVLSAVRHLWCHAGELFCPGDTSLIKETKSTLGINTGVSESRVSWCNSSKCHSLYGTNACLSSLLSFPDFIIFFSKIQLHLGLWALSTREPHIPIHKPDELSDLLMSGRRTLDVIISRSAPFQSMCSPGGAQERSHS